MRTATKSTFYLSKSIDDMHMIAMSALAQMELCALSTSDANIPVFGDGDRRQKADALFKLFKDFRDSVNLVENLRFAVEKLTASCGEEWWTDGEWAYLQHLVDNTKEFHRMVTEDVQFMDTFNPTNPKSYDRLLMVLRAIALDPNCLRHSGLADDFNP